MYILSQGLLIFLNILKARKSSENSFIPDVMPQLHMPQLVLIGRCILISYRGLMGSNTPVRALWATKCRSKLHPVEVSPENPSVCRSALVTEKKTWKLLDCVGGNITLKIQLCFSSQSFFSLRCINKEERVSAPRLEDGDLTLLQSSSVCVSPSPADSQ